MKFIELFAGIGGFRCGLEKANDTVAEGAQQGIQQGSKSNNTIVKPFMGTKQFTCVWANEWDKYACQIYRKNYGGNELYEADIRSIPAESIPDHDFLTGGFPCPTYSIAGKRKGFDDPRGIIFFEICRIAEVKQPALLLLENVKGLLNHQGGETFRIILDSLSELGYDCEWEVLNSKNFGVPQNRERVFIVGHLRGTGGQKVFPVGGNCIKNKETITSTAIDQNYWKGIDNYGQITMIYWKNSREKWVKEQKAFTTIIKTQTDLCRKPLVEDNVKIRRLTPTECERLQGFPDNWTEGISDNQRFKCLGNAVTVNVIAEIGKRIAKVQREIF